MTGRSGEWLRLQLSTVVLEEAVLLLLVMTGGSQAVVLLLHSLQLTAHLLHLPHTQTQTDTKKLTPHNLAAVRDQHCTRSLGKTTAE